MNHIQKIELSVPRSHLKRSCLFWRRQTFNRRHATTSGILLSSCHALQRGRDCNLVPGRTSLSTVSNLVPLRIGNEWGESGSLTVAAEKWSPAKGTEISQPQFRIQYTQVQPNRRWLRDQAAPAICLQIKKNNEKINVNQRVASRRKSDCNR